MKKIMGSVTKVVPEKIDYYKQLHANPWPEVNQMIKDCNISNYSIFLFNDLLFSYFEYTGEDYEADMQKMAEDEMTQKWWKETDPCQISFNDEGKWTEMEQVYYLK